MFAGGCTSEIRTVVGRRTMNEDRSEACYGCWSCSVETLLSSHALVIMCGIALNLRVECCNITVLVIVQRTFPVLRLTYSWRVTTYVGKLSATGQPTRPTHPFRSLLFEVRCLGSGLHSLSSLVLLLLWFTTKDQTELNNELPRGTSLYNGTHRTSFDT